VGWRCANKEQNHLRRNKDEAKRLTNKSIPIQIKERMEEEEADPEGT